MLADLTEEKIREVPRRFLRRRGSHELTRERAGHDKITPHLWFGQGGEGAGHVLYSNFTIRDYEHDDDQRGSTPTGDCDIISSELNGRPYMAMNAGPMFKFNPSISFFCQFRPIERQSCERESDRLWRTSLKTYGGSCRSIKYPFSEHYGWIQDKFGVSWQFDLSNPEGEERPVIVAGRCCLSALLPADAEKAVDFYISVFSNSRRGILYAMVRARNRTERGAPSCSPISCWMVSGLQPWTVPGPQVCLQRGEISFLIPADTRGDRLLRAKLSADSKAEQC